MIDSTVYSIANMIWELIEDEGEANKGYAAFLSMYGNNLLDEDREIIKNIMSEEYKHTCDLLKMAERLTGIKAEE